MNSKFNSANTSWSIIKTNWLISASQKIILFFTLSSISIIALYWSRLPPLVPLWFSKPWGNEQLAKPIFLFVLPAGSCAFHLINYLIGKYVTSEYLIFTQILYLTSLVVSVLSCVIVLKVIVLII